MSGNGKGNLSPDDFPPSSRFATGGNAGRAPGKGPRADGPAKRGQAAGPDRSQSDKSTGSSRTDGTRGAGGAGPSRVTRLGFPGPRRGRGGKP